MGALSAAGLVFAYRKAKGAAIFTAIKEADLALFDYFLLASLVFCISLNGIVALAPPSAADVINYHFAYPKIYAEKENISFILGSYQANIMIMHMLYTLGIFLSGPKLAALISWGCGVILAGAMVISGIRWFSSIRVGLAGAALFYTTPLFTQVAVTGHIEPGLILFEFLALIAFLEWAEDSSSLRWLVLSAAFAGFAAGTKYHGLFAIAIFFILVTVQLVQKKDFGLIMPSVCVFGLTAVVFAAPFYVRNFIHTGNPVYPVYYNVFGGNYWSEELNNSFQYLTNPSAFL